MMTTCPAWTDGPSSRSALVVTWPPQEKRFSRRSTPRRPARRSGSCSATAAPATVIVSREGKTRQKERKAAQSAAPQAMIGM